MKLTKGEVFSIFHSLVIGMIFLWQFIDICHQIHGFEPLTHKTVGIVTKVDPPEWVKTNKRYHFIFTSIDGEEYVAFWKTIATHKEAYYSVGDRIEIHYAPSQPTNARINRYEHLYHEYLTLFICFFVISFISVIMFLSLKKKRGNAASTSAGIS